MWISCYLKAILPLSLKRWHLLRLFSLLLGARNRGPGRFLPLSSLSLGSWVVDAHPMTDLPIKIGDLLIQQVEVAQLVRQQKAMMILEGSLQRLLELLFLLA